MRKTHSTVAIALALTADPFGKHWGYALTKASGIRSGVLYPILRRMYGEGWLTDGWENLDETAGRPPRRYYELTDLGRRKLGGLVVEASGDKRFAHMTGRAVVG